MIKPNRLILLILAIFSVVSFVKGINYLDPDFGWHLREGALILHQGIPQTDSFSYSMPSYRFIDHEWFTNVLISGLYKVGEMHVLSLASTILLILALFIPISKKFVNYSIIPVLLAGTILLSFAGIRTQIISWVFLALLLKIIFSEVLWRKWRFFVPLIFIVWVNLHGSFALGIVLLFIVSVIRSWQNKKIQLGDGAVFLLSVTATFINPYHARIWYEIWMQVSDQSLRWRILEWMPGILYTDISYLLLVPLSLSFILKYRSKIGLLKIIIYLVLLFMALTTARHIPLWAISTIFILPQTFFYLSKDIKKHPANIVRFNKLKKILVILLIALFSYQIIPTLMNARSISEEKFYPLHAVEYLKKTKVSGEVLSSYNYGGYLIWKLPEKKVFIDGRMPSWRRTGEFPGESNYAFEDWLKTFENEENLKKTINKYNINYILLSRNKGESKLEKFWQNRLFKNKNSAFKIENLKNMGMNKVYDDGRFVIYKR